MFSWIKFARWQFGRFVAVGSMGVVVDFVVYIILTRGSLFWLEHFLWANILSFFVANLHNFFWHRRWTFGIKGQRLFNDYAKFLSASLGYLLLIELGLVVFTRYGGWLDLIAKGVSTVIAVAIYFFVLRTFIFKQPIVANS